MAFGQADLCTKWAGLLLKGQNPGNVNGKWFGVGVGEVGVAYLGVPQVGVASPGNFLLDG